MSSLWRSCALGAVFCLLVPAQRRVPANQLYERIYLVLPMEGRGTWADPKRPLFMPAPDEIKPGDRSGILAWHFQISDNGQFALVEIVAANQPALAGLTARIRAQVSGAQLFDATARSRGEVEQTFKALKKDFDLSRFQVVVP